MLPQLERYARSGSVNVAVTATLVYQAINVVGYYHWSRVEAEARLPVMIA